MSGKPRPRCALLGRPVSERECVLAVLEEASGERLREACWPCPRGQGLAAGINFGGALCQAIKSGQVAPATVKVEREPAPLPPRPKPPTPLQLVFRARPMRAPRPAPAPDLSVRPAPMPKPDPEAVREEPFKVRQAKRKPVKPTRPREERAAPARPRPQPMPRPKPDPAPRPVEAVPAPPATKPEPVEAAPAQEQAQEQAQAWTPKVRLTSVRSGYGKPKTKPKPARVWPREEVLLALALRDLEGRGQVPLVELAERFNDLAGEDDPLVSVLSLGKILTKIRLRAKPQSKGGRKAVNVDSARAAFVVSTRLENHNPKE